MSDDRYRHTKIFTERGEITLRDDGCRIEFQLQYGGDDWILWAEYKQCDLPGPAGLIAGALMEGRAAESETQMHERVRRRLATFPVEIQTLAMRDDIVGAFVTMLRNNGQEWTPERAVELIGHLTKRDAERMKTMTEWLRNSPPLTAYRPT